MGKTKHHLSATQNSANTDLSRSVLAELVHDLPSHLHACTHSIGTSLCWQSGLAYIQKTEEREYSSLIDNQRPSIMAKPRRGIKFNHRNGHSSGADGRRSSFSDISEAASEPGSPTMGKTGVDGALDEAPVSEYEKKKATFITRSIWTFVMIGAFFGAMFMGHIYIIAIVTAVQIVSFKEVIAIANVPSRARRLKFTQFAWTHMALYLIVVQAHFIMNNVFEGMIWFFLPVSLVICNDIFAYICGITFGRTQLIKLSPKKTVEGFVGAWVLTIIFGVGMTNVLMRYKYFICPVNVGISRGNRRYWLIRFR